MVGEIQITAIGNITDDPELRFTPAGHAVANFTVACTARKFDKATSEYVDRDPVFLRCSVWRQEAENVAESLQRGMRVTVQGNLVCRPYETKEGDKRYSWEIEVQEVAASLKFATAKVTRVSRNGGSTANTDSGRPGDGDPWAQPSGGQQGGSQGAAQGGGQDPWGAPSSSDEPPF